MASCKVETEGRLHVDTNLVEFLREKSLRSTDDDPADDAVIALITQTDAGDNETFPLTITGPCDEEIAEGHVLLSIGPVSLDVDLSQLLCALRPFEVSP